MDEELGRGMKKRTLLSLIVFLFFLASHSASAGFGPGEYSGYEQKTQMLQGVFISLLVISSYSVMWTLIQFAAYTIARLVKSRKTIEKDTPRKSTFLGAVTNLLLLFFQAGLYSYIQNLGIILLLAIVILAAHHVTRKKGVTFKYYILGGFITSITIIFITVVVPLILGWLQ
jgi:hypothetical protein